MRLAGTLSQDGSTIELDQGGNKTTLTSNSPAGDITLTLPATSDTIVGRATTDTLTNKTLTSPTLTTPDIGTPSAGTLTNCTGLPISTGVSGLGTGVATFLGTPSSANLAAALTDETGSGAAVFATSPSLTTPDIGTPSAGTLTNCTGLPISSGVSGLGSGVATFLGTPSSANLRSALTDETGTGSAVFSTSPVLTTPQINDTSADHQYIVAVSELTADRTITLPLLTGNDTIVFEAHSQTLTNKTIDADNNTISNLAHGAEVDNPSSGVHGVTGSVVGTSDSQTLTNKTINASNNTISNVDLTSDITGTLPIGNGGTGQTTQTAAFDALAPTTTKGDVIVSNGSDNIRLAVGSDGTVLTADSGEASGLTWTTPLTNPMTTQGDIIIGGSSGAATRLAIGSTNTVLLSDATDPEWGLIANANVDASAAIAGSKIDPDFGSQNITTTGTLTTADIKESSGNLGLGATPSASVGAGIPVLELFGSTGGATADRSGALVLTSQDGTTAETHFYCDTDTYLWNTKNTNLRIATNDTERIHIANDGDIGLHSPPTASVGSGIPVLELFGTGTNDRSGALVLTTFDGSSGQTYIYHDTDLFIQNTTNTNMLFYTNNNEQMRLTGGGLLGVGETNPGYGVDIKTPSGTPALNGYRPTATTGATVMNLHSDVGGTESVIFTVAANGDVSSAGTISDIRAKKNVEAVGYGLQELLALDPMRFIWNHEKPGDDPSFSPASAQRLLEVMPELVTQDGGIDRIDGNGKTFRAMSISHQGIMAVLVRAVQELEARVAALET